MRALSLVIGLVVLCVYSGTLLGVFTQNNYADPYPLFSSSDPYAFLRTCERNHIKCGELETCCPEHVLFAASAYRQSATSSINLCGDSTYGVSTTNSQNQTVTVTNKIPLFNRAGPWNMIALFYDSSVANELIADLDLDVPPSIYCCDVDTGTSCDAQETGTQSLGLNLVLSPEETDPNKQFGFFNGDAKYQKYGARFDFQLKIYKGLSLQVQTGVAHIHVEPCLDFDALSCLATGLNCPTHECTNINESPTECQLANQTVTPQTTNACINANCCMKSANCLCKQLVIDRIMAQTPEIAKILGQNIDSFDKTAMEGTQVILNMAPMFVFNEQSNRWPFFIFTPFMSVGVSCPTGPKHDYLRLFSVPFGNSGHWGIGGRAGFSLDFVETIAFGAEIGAIGFTSRTVKDFPVPTHELQVGIMPEVISLNLAPGPNINFAAYINAYHFLYHLSAYFQYYFVLHNEDKFTSCTPNDFLVSKLRKESDWRVHMFNLGFTYDISPHFSLGIVAQIPFAGRNVFRSTTVLGTLQITY